MLASFKDPQRLHVIALQAIAADLRDRSFELKKTIPNMSLVDLDRKLLVLHSMGGLAGPRYALTESGAVEQIVGYAPVGFGHPLPHELAIDLATGMPGSIRHEFLPGVGSGAIELNVRSLLDVVHYYVRLRAIFEGLSCVNSSVIEDVDTLQNRGIPYHHIGFRKDIFVRNDPRIAQFVTTSTILERTGHLAPQVKSGRAAHAAAQLALAA